ncbi:MAG: DUF11 domain-containing protein [Anaerolineae bacterium]|nr:DUF11 domain-containing protein [Anaerolineae bacterium]
MKNLRLLPLRLLLALLVSALLAAGIALAFSTQWSTHFNSAGDLGQFDRYLIGDCAGQNHSVSGSSVHMRANYGADCFGAYYRDNNNHPNTFPTDQDVRVTWRWRYSGYEKYGTQAGQVTSAYGVVQYYGLSGVDTTGAGGNTNFPHVVTNGPWGSNGVDNPLWRGSAYDTNWHTSTFDFICDGTQLTWWLDSGQIHQASGPARPAGDPYRPYQFWFGNLLTDTPANGDWTGFDLDNVHIYAVERPQMNTPVPGGGGTQAVTWNAVPNTPQPDGSTWGIEYEAQVCSDPACSSPLGSSGWQAGTSYTFSGLEVNRTYSYRVRARWVGAPELVTCWGNTVSAEQVGVPELRLAKNATAEAGPGEVISYSLILQNSGSAGASGVVVRDPVPPYIIHPTNISGGGSLSGNEVIWNIGSLDGGESHTLSWQGVVAPGVPASVTQIVNTATASDNAGHTAQAQAATTVLVPGLSLAKSAPAEIKPGEGVSYSLTLANTGNMTLRQVVVRDPLPQYLLNPTGISHGGRLNGSEVVWEIGDLTAGESLVLAWRATVDPLIPVGVTELLNRATVTTQIGLTAEAQAASRVIQPQMRVIKVAPEKVMPGQEITYTLTISNAGSVTLYQVRLEDPLPAYITPVPYSISDGGYEVPGRLVWDNLGDIPPGQSRAVSWRGTIDPLIPPEVHEIRNVAVATAGGGLTETGETLSEVLQPGLALVKEASATAYAGGEIAYYLHLSNNGPGLARFIEVHDPLPAYTFFVPDVAPSINNYGTLEGSEVVWRLNELGPGETATLRWRGQVNLDVPAGVDTIPNEARATSLETPNPVLAQASTRLLDPGLRLSQTCPTPAQAGNVLTYTARVENGSNGVARSAVVRAPVPAGLSYIPGSATAGGRLAGNELIWELGTLAPGVRVELAFSLQTAPDLAAGQVASVVSLYSDDQAVIQRSCQTALFVPALKLTKIAPAQALANEEIEYSLAVENRGPVVAHNAGLTDSLPLGADYVPGTASDGGAVGDSAIFWQLGDLAPGQRVERRFRAVVHAPWGITATQIYNEAAAGAERAVTVRVSAVTLVPRPVFQLTKTAPAQVKPGEIISYSLTALNSGPGLARQALLRDNLPEGVIALEDTIAAAGGFYDPVQRAVTWPLGDLPAGTPVERQFAVLVPVSLRPGGLPLQNRAFLTSPDAIAAYAQATTGVTSTFILVGEKTATPFVKPGERIDYAIQVHNGSPNLAANVVIRDPLPPYTTYLTDTASLPPVFEENGQILLWNLGVLASGETREVRFTVQVAGQVPDWLDRVTNTAAVSYSGGSFEVQAVTLLPSAGLAAQASPTPTLPTAPPRPSQPPEPVPPTPTPLPSRPPVVEVPPPATASPSLTAPVLLKAVSPETVPAGQTSPVTWTLTFSNPTSQAVSGVIVTDPLPPGLVYLGHDTTQGQVQLTGDLTQTVIVATLGDVPPSGQATIGIVTQIISETVTETVYTNTARYTAATLPPGMSNEARVTVVGQTPFLPVTGGLLDPRTPAGRGVWGGVAVVLLLLALGRRGAEEQGSGGAGGKEKKIEDRGWKMEDSRW